VEDTPKQQSGETFQGHAFEHTQKLYHYSWKDRKQHNTDHIHKYGICEPGEENYKNTSIFSAKDRDTEISDGTLCQ
jgi:hypothetical protein